MSPKNLDSRPYEIRTFDGRPLAFPFIDKPDLEGVIVPPPPKPVYALPTSLKPDPFMVVLEIPDLNLYQIGSLVDDRGGLVDWTVSPQKWVVTPVGPDTYFVQTEKLASAWTAPPEGKFEQILVKPVPWLGQPVPTYPTEFMFRFFPV